MFTAQNIIDFAVRLEKNGETVYRDAQGQTSGAAMDRLLAWAEEEERAHGEWFASLSKELDANEDHHLTIYSQQETVERAVHWRHQLFFVKYYRFSD